MPVGFERDLLCDPQTSGGLLVSVSPDSVSRRTLVARGLPSNIIGEVVSKQEPTVLIHYIFVQDV